MKPRTPRLGDRVILTELVPSPVIAFELYQPEAPKIYTLDTPSRTVRAQWDGESDAWVEITFKDDKPVARPTAKASDVKTEGLRKTVHSAAQRPVGRRETTGAGSNPASSTTLSSGVESRHAGHCLSSTEGVDDRASSSAAALKDSGSSAPPAQFISKEVSMPPPRQTEAIAPAAVTVITECPPPAPGSSLPARSHPFRQSFRPRANRKCVPDLVPSPEKDLVVTRIHHGPVCESEEVRTCRVCKCTDDDCSQCIAKTGQPCTWVGIDLCSACQGFPGITHSSAASVRRPDYVAADR